MEREVELVIEKKHANGNLIRLTITEDSLTPARFQEIRKELAQKHEVEEEAVLTKYSYLERQLAQIEPKKGFAKLVQASGGDNMQALCFGLMDYDENTVERLEAEAAILRIEISHCRPVMVQT